MEYYTLLQSWPLHVVNREIFFCKIKKIKIVGLRCLGKENYLVEVDRLLTDFLCEIDELEVVLGQVVHLHESVSVLKLAEYGVLLSDGAETGVGVVPGVLTLAVEGLTAL